MAQQQFWSDPIDDPQAYTSPPTPTPVPFLAGAKPPAPGAPGTYQYGSPNDPTKYTDAGKLLGLQLNQGLTPQQAADAVNKYFNLQTGSQATVYGGKGPNGTDLVSLANPNGYYSNNGGTWAWNARQAETGAPTGPSPGSAPTAFDWPTFTAPTFNAPAPYSYPSFEAPTLEDAQNAPGYQFGLQQGLGAMTNSRAAQGVFRTGATPKAFFDYANSAAEQNYGNVFNQRLSAYQTNATNAANTYNTNYTTAKDTYNSAFQNAAAEFNPKFQASQLTFQDMYNRWRDGLAATTAVATAGAH